jgi:hypothetical protein
MCCLLPRNGPISFHVQVETSDLAAELEEYPEGGVDAGYASLICRLQLFGTHLAHYFGGLLG